MDAVFGWLCEEVNIRNRALSSTLAWELPNSVLRVVSFFSSAASPARSLLISGGAVARRGCGCVAWLVHSSCTFSFSLFAAFASMAYESRSTDLGGQIRRAVVFFLLAAVRRWQAVLQATSMKTRISPNKVRTGSIELGLSGQPWIRVFLHLLDVVLWWSEFLLKKRFASFHKAELLLLCCFFFDLHPLASGSAEFDGGSMHFAWRREARLGIFGDEEFDLLCRSGCEEKRWLFGSEVLREISLTTTCGDHQRWRICASVFYGRWGRSVLWWSLRHGVFNLQAGGGDGKW